MFFFSRFPLPVCVSCVPMSFAFTWNMVDNISIFTSQRGFRIWNQVFDSFLCIVSYSKIMFLDFVVQVWCVRKGKFGATMLVHTFDELVNIFLLSDVTLVFPLTQLSSRINIMVNHHVLIPTPWDQTSLYDVLMMYWSLIIYIPPSYRHKSPLSPITVTTSS